MLTVQSFDFAFLSSEAPCLTYSTCTVAVADQCILKCYLLPYWHRYQHSYTSVFLQFSHPSDTVTPDQLQFAGFKAKVWAAILKVLFVANLATPTETTLIRSLLSGAEV